jgi:HSP20 family protein
MAHVEKRGAALQTSERGATSPLSERLEILPARFMDRVERLLGRWEPGWPFPRWPEQSLFHAPALDVYEEGDAVVVETELPGMKKEDVEIKLTGNLLAISATRHDEKKVERKNYLRLERSSGALSRTVRLPVDVQADKITATLKDGVLEVRAPKAEAAKAETRSVTVT